MFFRCESPDCFHIAMSKSPSVEIMAVKEKQKEVKPSNVFVFEDNSYRESIFENLCKLRKNKQFCDVILQVCIY